MLLFDEMEKTFPDLEKVFCALLAEREELLDVKGMVEEAEERTLYYAMSVFLDEESTLYSLFRRAGFTRKRTMGDYLIKWMLINKRFHDNSR